MTDDKRIAAIRARIVAATPGPWDMYPMPTRTYKEAMANRELAIEAPSDLTWLADECDRLATQNKKLREALENLANAADTVGVSYFDTDTMDPEVEAMQSATNIARAALSETE